MSRALKGRLARWAVIAAFAAALALGNAATTIGASITFGTPSANSVFLTGITFTQPYSGAASFREVDVVVSYPGSLGPVVSLVESPGTSSFSYLLKTSEGQLEPNTAVTAHFEVIFSDGSTQVGPEVSVTYQDTRFAWKTKTGSMVRLHWYSGSDSFASQALDLAEKGLAKAKDFMGSKSSAPVDFFVYATESPFRDALGPSTRENVGGLANTTTRTLFALIAPGDMSYAQTVVPHELTHVIFDEVTSNEYHFPPHWLNEGVAVYVAQGYDSYDRGLVSSAARNGTVMPLVALGGQFPTSQDRFYLAYAESVSAIDFFIKTYGKAALDKLLTSFGTGASDDEAFTAAIGKDMAAFDNAWISSIGAKTAASYGPKAAPTGPIPPGWTGPGGAVASGAPSAGEPSLAPATPAPGEGGGSGSSDLLPALVVGIVLIGLGCVVAAALLLRRSRATPSGGL